MIAKYDGECRISGREIIAGETEIEKYGGCWVVAEYANKEAKLAAAEKLIEQLEGFFDRRSRALVATWRGGQTSMHTLQSMQEHVNYKLQPPDERWR